MATTTERKRWHGDVPDLDNFNKPIRSVFIDGLTMIGEQPWAIMTPDSHIAFGVGLGTGKGQKYRLEADNVWYKVSD